MKRFLSPIILLWVVTIVLCIITAYTVFDRVQADRSETIRDAQRDADADEAESERRRNEIKAALMSLKMTIGGN